MIALLIMTDGRDTIEEALPSALANLKGPITRVIINDDSGDLIRFEWLKRRFGDVFGAGLSFRGSDRRRGFGGAINSCWSSLADDRSFPDVKFVFHCEDDFTFTRPVDLEAMAEVLLENPDLVQLALRRQPWNAEECAAGGIVEQHPDDFTDCGYNDHQWLEHRRFFTTNPSLYRRSLCDLGWPDVERSEGVFTHQLLEDPDVRFGYWGARDSGEAVTHIGTQRVGVGY